MAVEQPEVTRRAVVRAAAWSVPVIALAIASPASAASLGTLRVELMTDIGAEGYVIHLRDGKFRASDSNTLRTNTMVVVTTFRVVDAGSGQPVPGATCVVDGGDQRDAEGHFILSAAPFTTTGTIEESTTKRTATEITDTGGTVKAKLATATWAQTDCPPGVTGPFLPEPGTLTVFASAPGFSPVISPFPYFVYDGSPVVGGGRGCR